MSKSEILSELPRLTPDERAEIAAPAGAPSRVLLRKSYVTPFHSSAGGPTGRERAILNEAQAAYDADPSAGSAWREVETRLRKES